MNKLTLNIDGKEVEVLAQKLNGRVWFHYDGLTYEYAPQSSQSQGAGGAGAQDPTKIIASMPGKIIKVFFKAGDKVREGDTVVAMEAMKMEYNLKAAQDMQVKSINCSEGQQVSLGEVLVDLEEING